LFISVHLNGIISLFKLGDLKPSQQIVVCQDAIWDAEFNT